MPHLVVLDGYQSGTSVPLSGVLEIGRSAEARVVAAVSPLPAAVRADVVAVDLLVSTGARRGGDALLAEPAVGDALEQVLGVAPAPPAAPR